MERIRFESFDIVTAPYCNLLGEVQTLPSDCQTQYGLFMVVKVSKGNIIAFKITSNSARESQRTVTLKRRDHIFLRTDSYVQTDRPHTLDPEKCKKIGAVSTFIRPIVISTSQHFFVDCIEDMEKQSGFVYQSPNKVGGNHNVGKSNRSYNKNYRSKK